MPFGRYQLIATLGHGGMADVYLAVARGPVGFNKLQVVKRLRPNLAEEPEFLAMFLDEARLAARLNHPNVVQTNEVGEAAGSTFIAMEYLDGQPLNRILSRGRRVLEGGLTQEVLLTIVVEALAGLHHAHELHDYDGSPLGVVHRDASPHNIFVTYEGQVKLVDFGIAKAANRSVETRAGGMLKGKLAYMSPEQARCEEIDRRADIFSMGAVLWEVLAGERLWRDPNDIRIVDALAVGTPMPTVRSVRPDVARELDAICAKALAINPAARYATADHMRRDILTFLDWVGKRPTPLEEIGQVVAQLFQDKRAELRTLVDAQLAAIAAAPPTLTSTGVALAALTTSSSLRPPTFVPSETLEPGVEKGSQPTLARAATAESMTPLPAQRPRRWSTTLIAAAAVVFGGIGAFITLRGRATEAGATQGNPVPAAPAPPTADDPAGTTSAVSPARGEVLLSIEATPKSATIELDGRSLGANPYLGRRPADPTERELRISAKGYDPEVRRIALDRDVQLVIDLQRAGAGARVPSGGGKPRAPTTTPTEPEVAPPETAAPDPGISTPGRPKKRDLDTSDPWAK